MYIPNRGDIVWMNLSPTLGSEQKGKRPCYVHSPKPYNRIGLVIISPITSKVKGYGGEVHLPISLKTKGVILSDHIRTLDWKIREVEFKENTPDDFQNEVFTKLEVLLNPNL